MTDAPGKPAAPRLRQRIFASVRLSSLQFLSKIGLRLVSTVVLTRLLAPEIYGVFATVLVYRYLLEMMSDMGFRALVVTREGKIEVSFLRTVWTVNVLRGVGIFMMSSLIAWIIVVLRGNGVFAPDSAYADPVLPWAIAALGATSMMGSLQSPNTYVYARNMTFRRITAMHIAANVSGVVVTILLAWFLRSVWALVAGAVTTALFIVVTSNLAFKGPAMRLHLDRNDLAVIWDRGKWIIGLSTLTGLSRAADRLVLGFIASSTLFGYYFIARQVTELAVNFLNMVHSQMGLQVFRRILKSPLPEFRRNYYRYRLFFDGLSGLAAGGLVVLAPLLVEIIFDDRYAPVAEIISILALAMLLIGPYTWREVHTAELKFRQMTLLSLVSTVTLWVGLAITAMAMGSFTASLYVIALYRLSEILILWVRAWRAGRARPLQEATPLAFFVLGAAIGAGILAVWPEAW